MNIEQLFGHDLTDEIRAAAKKRLLNGGNISTLKGLDRSSAKLILLLVREINPMEELSRDEKAILMGMNRQTVTKMEQEKRFVHVVNH